MQRRNWKQETFRFLCQYRATPHSTTNTSPCETLNNRKLNTLLPEPPTTRCKRQKFMFYDASASLAQRDGMQKQEMKIYPDRRENAQERNITSGEIILMKQPKQNKLSTPYNPKPFAV